MIKFVEADSRMVVTRGQGRENRELLSGYNVSVMSGE